MANLELLKATIDDSGMTMVAIAKKSGIERTTLYNRLNGIGDFTSSEIVGLSTALKMSKPLRDRIFLSKGLH
jgi:predicted transcriptional regulator